jgi:hypothetical protein
LSGGGSRAALFSTAGLEALARLRTRSGASALEQVAYVSSVSGGSLAAGYYAVKKPPRDVPTLTPEGELTDAYRAFFAQARTDLSQISNVRWWSSNCWGPLAELVPLRPLARRSPT